MSLERAYRRLLAWYPAAHRREHEEEMLGVLLAAAPEGQRRPRPREAANLIGGALRIRLRRAPAEESLAIWRDALAVFSVIAPLFMLMLVIGVPLLYGAVAGVSYEPSPAGFALRLLVEGQLVLVILVLLRLRRTALLVAVVYLGLYVIVAANQGAFYQPGWTFLLLIALSEAAALTAAPGPRRGLALIRGRRLLLIPLAGAALAVLLVSAEGYPPSGTPGVRAASAAVLVLLLTGLGLASPLSRRLLLLLAIPGVPFVLIGSTSSRLDAIGLARTPPAYYLAVLYVMPVLVTAMIIVAARRARRRPARGVPAPGGAPTPGGAPASGGAG